MVSLKSVDDNSGDTSDFMDTGDQSRGIKIIAFLAAIALTAAILAGYFIFRKKHTEKVASQQSTQRSQELPTAPPKTLILIDEPIRKGPQVTIGGKVQNISQETLSNLSVEIGLEHKKDGTLETRTIEVRPGELAPNQEGIYNVTLTGDYTNLKLLRIKSGTPSQEVGFRSAPGAKRPFEEPARTTKTIIVGRPKPQKEGEEFINTPDNPARIP